MPLMGTNYSLVIANWKYYKSQVASKEDEFSFEGQVF